MSKYFKGKGRSVKTHQNKIRKIKNYYKKLFKNSVANKKENEKNGYKNPNKKYFCDKFPTEKDYLKTVKIKEVLKAEVKHA